MSNTIIDPQLAKLTTEFEALINKHYPPKVDPTPDTMVFLYRMIVKDGQVVKILRSCIPESLAEFVGEEED